MKKARLNIYVGDPTVRKQVKTAAAKQDISVSDYCLQAIVGKLAEEGEGLPERNGRPLSKAIQKARRFQQKAFSGRTFSVSSATLIAQARRERTRKEW